MRKGLGSKKNASHAGPSEYAAAIASVAREPLLVLDPELCVVAASDAFFRTFKTNAKSTLGVCVHSVANGQWDIPALRQMLNEILAGHAELRDQEVQHDFAELGSRTLRFNARRVSEDGSTLLILLAIEDATGRDAESDERRQAEKQIGISEARYRRLFETAPDGILIVDPEEGRIIDVNRALVELLRHPREHYIGKQIADLRLFVDAEAGRTTLRRIKEQAFVRDDDAVLQDRDGREIPVEFVCNRYHEDQRVVYQCNVRDIRVRKLLDRERDALLSQEHAARIEAQSAERSNRATDVFLATLSHELRTPLSAILGWATIIGRQQCTETELKEGIKVIERNARAQAKLIEEVLDVSRIVSGKMTLEIRPCDLTEAITAAVDAARPAALAKQIRIETRLGDELQSSLPVHCDPQRVQQAIGNLLSNSIKFTPAGGSVKVSLDNDGTRSQIVISDTGAGFAPEFSTFLFDRFRQADESSRRKSGGLGLGLTIVKNLVELHGGTVKAESAGPGHGSTFTITLPNRPAAVAAPEAAPPEATPSVVAPAALNLRLDGVRILVVDDEEDARRLVGKVLGDVGASVDVAASVGEALGHLRRSPPNILISDLGMPDEDGFDLIRKVRASGHTVQQLPAVALTAFANKSYARQALLAGYQMHVSKPVDPRDLITVVASLVGRTA